MAKGRGKRTSSATSNPEGKMFHEQRRGFEGKKGGARRRSRKSSPREGKGTSEISTGGQQRKGREGKMSIWVTGGSGTVESQGFRFESAT